MRRRSHVSEQEACAAGGVRRRRAQQEHRCEEGQRGVHDRGSCGRTAPASRDSKIDQSTPVVSDLGVAAASFAGGDTAPLSPKKSFSAAAAAPSTIVNLPRPF